jgi:hypothetical protein
MKIMTIATVDSSVDRTNQYVVIQRGSHWECNCKSFFFSQNRNDPCKHIEAIRTLDRVKPGEMTQRRVHLTDGGTKLLKCWREHHGLPLVKPEE